MKDGAVGSSTSGLGVREAMGATLVALLWALCYPLIATATAAAPPILIGALRALVAGILLVLVSVGLGRRQPRGRDWIIVVGIGATWTALGFGGMFLAGGQLSPGLATVIANAQPLMAALIGYWILDERLETSQAVGLGIAFTGIALVAAPALLWADGNTVGSAGGISYVLLGALGVAMGNVLMKRYSSRLDAIASTGWQLLIGAVFLFVAASLSSSPISFQWTPRSLLALAGLAIPGTAVAFALWFALLDRAPLNSLNVFTFLTPIFALGIGIFFYGERLTSLQLFGALLVLGGAWMAARREEV